MGEIADAYLDGTFDMETGEYLGEGPGYPRTAADLDHDFTPTPRRARRIRQPATSKSVFCPFCGKQLKTFHGMRDHAKDAHRVKVIVEPIRHQASGFDIEF